MKRILSYGPVISGRLEVFLRTKHAETGPSIPWEADLLERLLPFATTGKLLRGSLVCFSYEAFSGRTPDENVLKAAMAVELTHSALLVHDDIMDDDAVRRGQPSLHQQYRTLAAKEKLADTGHFGDSLAMCVGDAAIFMAFELLAGSPAGIQQLFTRQLVTTCAGQMQDLYLEARPDMPSKQAIYDLMETKTAAYTLSLPLAMGAALAGQGAGTQERLQVIGRAAGTIFQIRDDELGVMGDSRKTGKPVGADITEGKKTLLYYHLLERCAKGERAKVQAIFGNPAAGKADIAYIRTLAVGLGIPAMLNNEIDRLERQTAVHIEALDLPKKTQKEFTELVRFCGKRLS